MTVLRKIIGYVFILPSAFFSLLSGVLGFVFSIFGPERVEVGVSIAIVIIFILPAVAMTFLGIFLTHPPDADREIKGKRYVKIWRIFGAFSLGIAVLGYFASKSDIQAELPVIENMLQSEAPISTPESVIITPEKVLTPEREILPDGKGKSSPKNIRNGQAK